MPPTSPLRSWARPLLALLTVAPFLVAPSGASAAVDAGREARKKDKPLPRVKEMVDWIAVEQQADGGWAHRLWLPLPFHVHQDATKPDVPPQSKAPNATEQQRTSFLPTSFDTAMCGLALVRAGNTLSTGARRAEVGRAAEYLYRQVQSGSPKQVTIDGRPTPFTDRIGARADTFAALLFFVTLREHEASARAQSPAAAKGDTGDHAFTYDGVIGTLISKSQETLDAEGRWPEGGAHCPLLSHALGCWALEAATRADLNVKPDVLARAERFALTKDAELESFKAQDRWRKTGKVERPKWLNVELADDNDPLGHSTYIMAARLSILYHADLTNRTLLRRERAKYGSRRMTEAQYAKINALAAAAGRTKASLESGRDAVRRTWARVHKNDVNPSPSPIFFTAEDYLSSLLVVDAMAECADVQQWFPPIVRWMMPQQDFDGGLRIQEPVMCRLRDCRCAGVAAPAGAVKRPVAGREADFGMDPQFCPGQKSWCSRDRTFVTAAGLMILLADTPYRPAFMGAKN